VTIRLAALSLAAVALACAAALGGCSREGIKPPANGNPWTVHGVVRIVDNEEPNSLVRMFSHQAAADDVTALLFEPLFRFDEHGEPVPALATTFPTQANGLISKDGLRITFPLRADARWSDGAPVTSSDVVFTWHAIVDGRNPVASTAGYDAIADMVADGPHRVTMVLKQAYAPAVFLFSEGSYPPLPSHLLAGYPRIDHLPYDADPVGDGPFLLARWIHGSDLIFAPNPRYWRGPPHLREIDIRIIPNSVTDVDALKTHEIDVLDGVSKNLAGQLASIPGVDVVHQLSANYRHLDLNTRNPLLADVVVRRAIAQSIDFERIIHDVYGGFGLRSGTTVPPMSWAANGVRPLPFDPAGASLALDADGWLAPAPGAVRMKDGRPLSLAISSSSESTPNQEAEELIVDDLRRVGIDVHIKNYATTTLFAPDGPLYGGHYDMAWIVDTEGTDPDILGSIGCAYIPPAGADTVFYCNPRVDALLRDAETHYDAGRRRRDYADASRILVGDAPFVVAYWEINVIGYDSDLRNFRPSPYITDFWNAWEWRI